VTNIITIVKKELRGYFNSLIAYIVIVVFTVISGYFFVTPLFIAKEATIKHLVQLVPLLYLFFIPAITMRLISEEIKTGTLEILLTHPVEDYEILLGKYAASLVFLSIMLLLTLFYPLSMVFIGGPGAGQVAASYIGMLFLGAAFLAAGVFASALTKNQIVSFIITFLICFAFYVMAKTTKLMPAFAANIVDYIGIDRHYDNMARGIIDSRDVVYYLSVTVFFLYAALGVIKSRK
jgi:ABC-2 type transport system permease protein